MNGTRYKNWPGLAVAVAMASMLAASGETRPSTFYTLSPVAEEQGSTDRSRSSGLALGVGPISLPKYLDRPQVVTRPSANRLNLAEFHRWGEPLDLMLSRTIAENLAASLGTDAVFQLPRQRVPKLDYQVVIDVIRFDVNNTGQAGLNARWMIYKNGEREPRVVQRTLASADVSNPDDYESIVVALSGTIETMSGEIAAAIESTY